MNRRVIFWSLLALGLAGIAVAGFFRASRGPECASIASKTKLDVLPLVDAPQCVQRTVEVRGTVNQVLAEKQMLMLIDVSEKENCDDGCPIKRLPVAWTGALPSKGETVLVSGALQKQENKYLFAAKTLSTLSAEVSQ